MLPYFKDPFESATSEVLHVLKLAWADRKTYFYIALWPLVIPMVATIVSAAVISQVPGKWFSVMIGLLSAVVTLYAITLTEVRVYRFVALNEGRDVNQVAPLRIDGRLFTFLQYKLLLTIPSMILPLSLELSVETILFMLAYHLVVLRLSFLFTAIALDRHPNFMQAWTKMAPVFVQLLLVELVFAGFVLLAAMPLVSIMSLIFGQGAMKLLIIVATPLRIVFTQLLAIVDMRFYWRAVLKDESS